MVKKKEWCSFCGKHEKDVAKLVEGPAAAICNECVHLLADMMPPPPEMTPEQRKAADDWIDAEARRINSVQRNARE